MKPTDLSFTKAADWFIFCWIDVSQVEIWFSLSYSLFPIDFNADVVLVVLPSIFRNNLKAKVSRAYYDF